MNVPPEAFKEQGICEMDMFTRAGMSQQLKKSVTNLKQDSLFESCISVQRMVVEIMKENRNYQAMEGIFEDLQKLTEDISTQSESRLFGCFYLVRFFGDAFQDLDKSQYIYKERAMTRLADVSSRLVEQYKGKFGECKTLSGSASTDDLDPKIPYIMTISVQPYFTPEELASNERKTSFEKIFNIKKFIYETPMTTTGAKYSDDITEQAKKKTILETQVPFPFVIKRQRVVSQSFEIFSPIQTSTEIMEDRYRATKREIETIPPNPKTLQIVLKGSVVLGMYKILKNN